MRVLIKTEITFPPLRSSRPKGIHVALPLWKRVLVHLGPATGLRVPTVSGVVGLLVQPPLAPVDGLVEVEGPGPAPSDGDVTVVEPPSAGHGPSLFAFSTNSLVEEFFCVY